MSAADDVIADSFSTSPVAMVITRRDDGVCLAVNEAFVTFSGYPADQALGRSTLTDLRLWAVDEDRKHMLAGLQQTGGVNGLKVLLRRKDGTLRPTQLSAWPISYRGQACLMAIAHDLTAQARAEQARQQSEAALQQAHAQLEGRVAERTAELSATNAALAAEVAARQQAETALRAAERQVRRKLEAILEPQGDIGVLNLADVMDAPAIQALMNEFYQVAQIGMAILDRQGRVLVEVGWQDICARFHRVHPEMSLHCLQSDTQVPEGIEPGTFKLYRCQNNMYDMATPIVVGGQHLGNLFLGQFLLEDEPVDEETFRAQARRYGLDETDYLAALARVPRWSRAKVTAAMTFYLKLAGLVSSLSYSNIQLARSVTEREKLVASLGESERLYRELFTTANLAIFQSTFAGQVVAVNPEFSRMFGYTSPKEFAASVQNVAQDIFDDPGRRDEIIALRAQHPDWRYFESVYRRKDGSTFLGRSNIQQVMAQDGQLIFQGFIEDITQRKQSEALIQYQAEQLSVKNEELQAQNEELTTQRHALEEAQVQLRAVNADLERRVEARTHELSLANAALVRAARMKDEFLASMSHELRTPLTAVQGLAEALQMGIYGPLNEKEFKALGIIRESGQHLLDLITDILDLSKLEAGKLELQLGPVIVEETCQASLRFIRQLAQKKRLHVALAIDPQVTALRADSRRLKQMLVNLLSNAVKFTPAGGEVGLTVEGDEARQVVRFVVWDTGIGIAPENLPRLFKPFTQLDSRLAREYEGTGLGLSLVQSMAELHGGEVTVDSDGVPGNGSRFALTLPWRRVDEAAARLGAVPPAPSAAPFGKPLALNPSPAGPVLLVVDDNEATLATMAAILESQAFQVHTARDGTEALARAPALRPDAIVLDIQMPGVDGLEVIRQVRAHPDLADVPILALTALAMAGDRERCLEAGANAYLSKPADVQELVGTLRALLARRAP